MTDETAKALIDAINRLIEVIGRQQSVVHHHYTQPTTQPVPYTATYYNPHSPLGIGGTITIT